MLRVNRFCETLFWLGAFLILFSFLETRWFVITILIGILLMLMSLFMEGISLKKAKTFRAYFKKNELKLTHLIVLLFVIILIAFFIVRMNSSILNIGKQFADLIATKLATTWWIFVLAGLAIGLIIFFSSLSVRKPVIAKAVKKKYSIIKKLSIRPKIRKKPKKKNIFSRFIASFRYLKPKKIPSKKKKKIPIKKKNIFTKIMQSFKHIKLKPKKLIPKKKKIPSEKKKELPKLKLKKKELKIKKKHLYTIFFTACGLLVFLYFMNLFFTWYSFTVMGLLVGLACFMVYLRYKEKLKRQELKARKIKIPEKKLRYETDLDRLYRLVNEKGKLRISDIAICFKISKEKAEEWGKILESHNLIVIKYSATGEPELCKK